jgi:hypothetical protein
MEKIFEYMDAHKNVYIDNLAAAIEIKSVSAWPECRPEIVKMVKWMGSELEKCGATIEYCDVGMQDLPDGGKHFFFYLTQYLVILKQYNQL